MNTSLIQLSIPSIHSFIYSSIDTSQHINNQSIIFNQSKGPAIFSIALIATAFCLRTWRRNGIACDELLFLPGTHYAKTSNAKGALTDYNYYDYSETTIPLNLRQETPNKIKYKKTLAKKNTTLNNNDVNNASSISSTLSSRASVIKSSASLEYDFESNGGAGIGISSSGANGEDGMTSLKNDKNINNMNSIHDDVEECLGGASAEMIPLNISSNKDGEQDNNNVPTRRWFWGTCRGRRGRTSPLPSPTSTPHSFDNDSNENGIGMSNNNTNGNATTNTTNNGNNNKITSPTSTAKTGEKLKGIAIIARFFSSSQETNEYAPSGPMVASAGIDLCIPVLSNFHIFMLASKASKNDKSDIQEGHDDDISNHTINTEYAIPPQVLPLIFLSILTIRVIFPIKARRRFFTTIHSVISSPFYNVTLRDEFLGDVATSFVRPFQDICFAIFYFFASMYGIFTSKVSLEDTGRRLTHNVLLHNVVLPTCAVLPLLCRFLQTLRQAHVEQRRWPHLGNAFKYLTASLVISYGMTHSEEVRSPLWIISFLVCMIYQVWWDVFIDWELLTITPLKYDFIASDSSGGGANAGSGNSPSSGNCDGPVKNDNASSGVVIPFVGRIQLRSKRLFKWNKSYWRIVILNALFRFTWMLSFIPAYHLNTSTGEIKSTFSTDTKSVGGFIVALIELFRRSAWCILKLELETIKLTDEDYVSGTPYSYPSARVQYPWFAPKSNEKIEEALGTQSPVPPLANTVANTISMKRAAYRLLVKKLFILELFVWIGLYFGLGFVVSAYL